MDGSGVNLTWLLLLLAALVAWGVLF